MQHNIIVFPEPPPGNREHRAIQNRPPSFPPLIGREQEVLAACALLRRPDVRLLTLVGTGGVGKTRLGLAVAQALLDDFADGAIFVSLAPVSDPARILAAIAKARGTASA